MGIIAKQSIYASIITYAGIALGVVNILFYANILVPEQKGLLDSFLSISTIIVAFGSLGIPQSIHKFLPYYKNYLNSNDNDVFKITFHYSLIVPIVLGIIIFILTKLNPLFGLNLKFLGPYFGYYLLFAIFLFFYQILLNFNIGFHQNIWASFVGEVVVRLFNLFLIVIYYFQWLNFDQLVLYNCLIFLIASAFLFFNLYKKGIIKFVSQPSTVTKKLKPKILRYGRMVWLSQGFNNILLFIDSFFIIGFKGLTNFSFYSISLQLMVFLQASQRVVLNSAIPVIGESWRRNDLKNIQSIYTKTSNNLLWFSGLLFLLILSTMNEGLQLIRPEYAAIKNIVLILGISRMVDLSLSANNYILNLSKKHWKMDLLINTTIIALMIPVNYFSIKYYGATGSALANLLFNIVINTTKYLFLKKIYGLNPWDSNNKKLIIYLLTLFLMAYLLFYRNEPSSKMTINYALFSLFGKALTITILYGTLLFLLNLSTDFNRLVTKLYHRLLKNA